MLGRKWSVSKETQVPLLMAVAAFFLLAGYECIRSAATSLFVKDYGVDNLPAVVMLVPLGVLGFLYVYGLLLNRFGARGTLFLSTIGSGILIVAGYVLRESGFKPASPLLFVLGQAYVVLIIEQYWSYINSVISSATARRLNGPVCGISSLGAIAGGFFTSAVAEQVGTSQLLLCAALACIPASFISLYAHRIGGEPRGEHTGLAETTVPGRRKWKELIGLHLFAREPILIWILAIVMATQFVAAMTDFAFQGALAEVITDTDARTAFLGGIYARMNILAMFLQFIAAPVLLAWLRYDWVNIAIPTVQIGTCTWAVVDPSLTSTSVAYMVFKAMDYSIFRAAKEVLYIPLSFDGRYRSKELIDVFGYRFSKGGASLSVTVAASQGIVFTVGRYAALALGGVFIWMLMVIPAAAMLRRHNSDEVVEQRSPV